MTWWDKVKRVTLREAGAVKDEVDKVAKSLDEALAKKERELEATPAERVDMLLEEIEEQDVRIEEIEGRLREAGEARAAAAGIEAPPPVVHPEPATSDVLERLTVTPLDAETTGDRMSHLVSFDDTLLAALGDDLDSVVGDVQVEVMVLDAERSGSSIAVRAPTLSGGDVAAMVADIVARHMPDHDAAEAGEPS